VSRANHVLAQRGPTGCAIFSTGSTELFWLGPGAGLFLIFGDRLIRVEHRTADGEYATFTEARKAAEAFLAA
jgi:hypothetical protein